MSARGRSVTVRLSEHEQTQLETLANLWGCDRSAALREALRYAAHAYAPQSLPQSGRFHAVTHPTVTFQVRLNRKG